MANDVFDLSGQTAIVTGAGTGIGKATALLLAEHGCDVVIGARRVEKLEETAAAVRALGRRAIVQATDVTDLDQCRALVDRAIDELGHIDILINNAGGSGAWAIEDWTPSRWQHVIDLNLRSVFFLSQMVGQHMKARRTGSIVNISSGASQKPLPWVSPYGAAKIGVNSLTTSMAAWLGPYGVRVNCIIVGAVKSEGFVENMSAGGRDPDEAAAFTNGFRRAGRTDEVAYPVLFFVSQAASFVSGECMRVGGPPPLMDLSADADAEGAV